MNTISTAVAASTTAAFGFNEYTAILVSIIAIIFVAYMLIKKYDARIALFTGGLVLLFVAASLGKLNGMKDGVGYWLLNPFAVVNNTFLTYFGSAGFIIMLLFGYSEYMSKIGANDVTVSILTKPLLKIKSPYLLAVIMFLIGNLLSLVVPSASSLAIILMATLYPVLKRTGMSSLTAAAIIATSASIMPTPLGADNVIISKTLNIDIMAYTYGKHALVSIPGILVMGIMHYYWQKYMDKKAKTTSAVEVDVEKLNSIRSDLPHKVYMILPLLPIILLFIALLVKEVFKFNINLSVTVVTLISFVVAIIFEMVRYKSVKKSTEHIGALFTGMGTGFSQVVTLVVGATILVEGLKAIGTIDILTNASKGVHGAGLIIMLIFVFFILLIGLLSGSGNSALYAMIALVPALTTSSNVPAYMVTVPMQMASNLVRGLSPVAAVIVIVASMIKESPVTVVKRTAIPAFVTMIFTIALSVILFSFLGL